MAFLSFGNESCLPGFHGNQGIFPGRLCRVLRRISSARVISSTRSIVISSGSVLAMPGEHDDIALWHGASVYLTIIQRSRLI